MKTFYEPTEEMWPEILKRPMIDNRELLIRVGEILAGIRNGGEDALREYTRMFDGADPAGWELTVEEIEGAERDLDDRLKDAIRKASENIDVFHRSQIHDSGKIETTPGVWCWQKCVPVEKVGLYIPGGSAPLFSTVLMLAIPAKLAGCREIILCTPPAKDGSIHPAILFAARLAGVTRIFRIGGAQAIGAMAYGIVTPRVDKIFGPGNQYVMAAKQLVSISDVAVDMPAGPSEVAVLADKTSRPEFIAADLLSQAEHGADSQVILVIKGDELLQEINHEINQRLSLLPRKEIAMKSLENSRIIVFNRDEDMIALINSYAPEHLIICTSNYIETASRITQAGSVFLGNFTPESAGDYASGTNHTLPTNGWARSFSGVNIDSFTKKITFQEITSSGLKNLGTVIETMASAENLEAHRQAVSVRLDYLKQNSRMYEYK